MVHLSRQGGMLSSNGLLVHAIACPDKTAFHEVCVRGNEDAVRKAVHRDWVRYWRERTEED